MKSGTVNLDVLLKYVKDTDPSGESLDGNSTSGRRFGKLANKVLNRTLYSASQLGDV